MSQISIRLSLLLTWLWCFSSCSSNKSSWLWSISRSCWSTRGRWRTTGWSRSWRSSRGSRSCSCWRTRRGDKRVSCRYRNKSATVLKWSKKAHCDYFDSGCQTLCICHVFGLQMIFQIRRTSVVTNFMSTVRADNFCLIDWTIWQCFENELSVHKSFLHFAFAFQSTMFFPKANPASSSFDSLSYSSAALWIKTTGATDGRKSYDARFFFFKYRALISRWKD